MEKDHRITKAIVRATLAEQFSVEEEDVNVVSFDVTGEKKVNCFRG